MSKALNTADDYYPIPLNLFRCWSKEINNEISTLEQPSLQLIITLCLTTCYVTTNSNRWYNYCYGSGMLYLPAHVALCHMTTRLAWRLLFQSLRLFFYFFFLSFRSSYLGLPIDWVLALLLTHHRSTIDWVRDNYIGAVRALCLNSRRVAQVNVL